MKCRLFLLFSLLYNFSFGEVIRVTSTSDSGAGTLREAVVTLAGSGDTVLIDVKGEILLNTPITFGSLSNITIAGPSPKHSTIKAAGGFVGTALFQINACTSLTFTHFGFKGSGAGGIKAVSITGSAGPILFERVVFDGFISTSTSGGAMSSAGSTVRVRSCSFINNNSNNGGAAAFNGCNVTIENSTIYNNTATNQGGAIYIENSTDIDLIHNTIYQNNSPVPSTAFTASGATNISFFQSNAITDNGTQTQIGGAGSFTSGGGNVYDKNNAGDIPPYIAQPGDANGVALVFSLRPTILEDGYGMYYFPIVAAASPLVDVCPATTLLSDIRKAPRVLEGNGIGPTNADAGACEYTPLRVTNIGTTVGTVNSLPWALDAPQNINSINYIEFDIAGTPVTISPVAAMNLNGNYIIDGYSQSTSAVPGPGINGATNVTAAVLPITVSDPATVSNGFSISAVSTNSKISGLRIVNYEQYGISVTGTNSIISGCEIGLTSSSVSAENVIGGINISGANTMIGGLNHFDRNVISGNADASAAQSQIMIQPGITNTKIFKNIIGLTADGTTFITTAYSTYGIVDYGSSTQIGEIGAGNVISGFGNGEAINCSACQNLKVFSNTIGMDYAGTAAKSNGTGIFISGSAANIQIGKPGLGGGNLISGNIAVQIRIDAANGVAVKNNIIGPQINGLTAPVTTTHGIYFDHNLANNVTIGGVSVADRNIISGNSIGITVVHAGSNLTILNNFIGTTINGNAALANTNAGIQIQNTILSPVFIGQAGAGNVISGNNIGVSTGIEILGGSAHQIIGNIIGLDVTGSSQVSNIEGIHIAGATGVIIGGDSGLNQGNVISGNSQNGIKVDNGASGTLIRGNLIGTDITGNIAFQNNVSGIRISDATLTTIGGATQYGNVISGHSFPGTVGIYLNSTGSLTAISANFIGQNKAGNLSLQNYQGIFVGDSHSATIGGANPNFICSGTDAGIVLSSTSPAVVAGNIFGRSSSSSVLGMSNQYAVHVLSANNTIGNALPNIIINSSAYGILIDNELADGNSINNNFIGTDNLFTAGIGNTGDGIHIVDADNTSIGVSSGNTIIGNTGSGILLTGSVQNTAIQKNNMASTGGTSLTNNIGVYMVNGPTSNTVGGTYGASGNNTIGSSLNEGILIENASGNFIYGNRIGNNGSAISYPNLIGARLLNSDNCAVGDQSGKFNVISGNTGAGIVIQDSDGALVQSNLIGTNETGNGPLSNLNGIEVLGTSNNTLIGGSGNAALANTISANLTYGILIESSNTTVQRNFIGPTSGALGAMFFQDYGIYMGTGATSCLIGGDRPVEGNVILSNEQVGIYVQDGSNDIFGNYIGATSSYSAVGSQPVGIDLRMPDATLNTIGEDAPLLEDYSNVIMNHSTCGIRIQEGATANLIASNYIGIDPLNNVNYVQGIGVLVISTAGIDNQIGQDVADGENKISGNTIGIKLDGAVHTKVYNNRIGTNALGLGVASNSNAGILIQDGGFNTIGGTGLKANVISGNTLYGIQIDGTGSTNNVVVGNIIGANLSLISAAPNGTGVYISNGASSNEIGQAGTGLGNKISGNNIAGIIVDASNSNDFINNRIGLPFANKHGVVLQNGASLNQFGGTAAERNYISNNDSIGVAINNADNNIISGNFIGTTETGMLPAPNLIGIYLNGSNFTEIGNQNFGNLISANTIAGILAENAANNQIKNNFIGTDSSGNAIFAASQNGIGIFLKNSSSNLIGGNNTIDEENIICNNSGPGIYFDNADNNEIYGNRIGINKAGTNYLPNTQQGIYLENGSGNNTIGSSGSGLSNAIAANSKGIHIKFSESNIIASNFIGNNTLGTATLIGTNNQQIGIHLDTASTFNNTNELNVIGGNTQAGLKISGPGTSYNIVAGNYLGINISGVVTLSNGVQNLIIADSASHNLIGGATVSERNYFGGSMNTNIWIDNKADSNQVAGNFINLAPPENVYWTPQEGVVITNNSQHNIIGGGNPGEGNFIIGSTQNGIKINNSDHNSILGNTIGETPGGFPGNIGNAGVLLEGADNTWIGSYLVGSDSMNTISYCKTGVAVKTIPFLNSSYGNIIGGNRICFNTNQGIDLVGDDLVMPIDTNNSNILIDNGGMDRPEIISAWECSTNGNTWLGFKFYASNALPNYHIEVYRNPNPDGSGYGEGEVYLGDFIFSPATNYDTISIDLGQTLTIGAVLTATITGVLGNTSEFSQQFVVTAPPLITAPVVTDETCLGADNGTAMVAAPDAYAFTTDGGLTWTYSSGNYSAVLPTGTHTLEALYLNGCTIPVNIILNPGTPLPFGYTVEPDTCGLNAGDILLDTISTNLAGGSGNYVYTFSSGSYYGALIDTIALAAGTYNIGLWDTVLGCFSTIDPVVVNSITDVVDESFIFPDFCDFQLAVPSAIATAGGNFTFETTPLDGAALNLVTGEITAPVAGNSYSIIYEVGICFEKDTVLVTALLDDDPSFTMVDYCEGSSQTITITGLAGGTFSFDPTPVDGATIDPVTGIINGFGGTAYTIKYLTNGPCPDSATFTVNVLTQPSSPQIVATDSIYCPGDLTADLYVSAAGTTTPNWTVGSSSGTVLGTTSVFNPANLNTGNNYIYVALLDVSSCVSGYDSINYYLSDLSTLTAGTDIEACIGSMIQLNATGGIDYLWSVNDDLSETDIANPTAFVDDEDNYIVTISDIFGCNLIDTVKVTLLPLSECNVETYNSFSPNTDGKNDYWLIDGIEGYPVNTVTIFTRWGDVMRKFDNYNNATNRWDGTLENGKLVPPSTYYFVVDVQGVQSQAGWLQVVY